MQSGGRLKQALATFVHKKSPVKPGLSLFLVEKVSVLGNHSGRAKPIVHADIKDKASARCRILGQVAAGRRIGSYFG
jgi:hypothetical protein